MLFAHPSSGRRLRLAYCMNLHPAETLDEAIEGMRRITLPLAERLGGGEPFGVGMYFPAALAAQLVDRPAELERLTEFLAGARLDPFTYNAFPAGGFGARGLKQRVFEPTWTEPARLEFTRHVARIAAVLASSTRASGGHVSISTHTGMHASRVRGDEDRLACARNLWRAAHSLAELEAQGAPRMVLSLEPEPRASCNDTRELVVFLEQLRDVARGEGAAHGLAPGASIAVLERHLGVCLDTCHAAVEFETPSAAVGRATQRGALGKLQFSSALALARPAEDAAGREALLSMDEPVYLHQVTGLRHGDLLRCGDLSELGRRLEEDSSAWLDCSEWRCHFHVPVDLEHPLERASSGGLATTRDTADELLDEVLAQPNRWGTEELHVEIETYTWNVLPGAARGEGELVDGLAREYEHVLARLTGAGWTRASGP